MMDEIATFESLRPVLFSLAYRMFGRVSEAEDIVQDAFLRYQHAIRQGTAIDSPKAFLSAIVTRLCIDHLRSARERRETYFGEWLPEPLLTGGNAASDPALHAEQADSLSLAFLVLLEQLTPVERAVFLLHDVFGYDYDEIAMTVGKSEQNCRQLAARARRRIEKQKPRFDVAREDRERLADRFFAATRDGDVDALVEMLATDAVVYGDGGGKAPSWPHPITGRERVSQLLAGLGRQLTGLHISLERHDVNGQPGAIVRDARGGIVNVFALDILGGRVQTIRSVINPEKLRHLGALADIRALLDQRQAN